MSDLKKRESFDTAARIYDEARPSYPDEVIDWILDRTQPDKQDVLLEIGAGTGQATKKFAQRGYSILCVELGQNLADLLMKNCRGYNVAVDVAPFEIWNPPNEFKTSFIFSATAFHWIDPAIRYRKCHELLRDGGHLVLIWNMAPDTDIPEIREAYRLLWEQYPERQGKTVQNSWQAIGQQRQKEIMDSGLFTLDDYLEFKRNPPQSREVLLKGFFSQSAYLTLNQDQQNLLAQKVRDLYSRLDDVIEPDLFTTAYIARKLK